MEVSKKTIKLLIFINHFVLTPMFNCVVGLFVKPATGIKLRLALKKPEEQKQDDQFGSTSRSAVTVYSSVQNANESHHQVRCFTSAERDTCAGNSDFTLKGKFQSSHNGSAPKSDTPVLSVYDALFQNWVPPPLTVDG